MNLLSGISIAGMIRVFFEFTLGFLLCLNKSHFSSIFSKTREFASIFFVGMMAVSISYYDSAKYLFLPATAMLVVHLGIKSCYVSNILSANVFLYFGKISFSIYMWHWIVINIHNWLRDNSIISVKNDLDIYAATASIIAITIFISHFSYLYIELPARQWINKMKQ
jgi:peptidoglycan/LPS O-acetylase OafA/YrhL